jgi:hypothetical protein
MLANEGVISSLEGAKPCPILLSEDRIHFRCVCFNSYELIVKEEKVLVSLVNIVSSNEPSIRLNI